MRRRVTRRSGLLVVFAMVAGLLAATVGTASAAPAVTVTPSTNLIDGQTVSVSIVADADWPSGVFYGVTQCGNQTSGGAPITVQDPSGGDCITNPAALGTSLGVVSNTGSGPAGLGGGITSGNTYTTPLVLKRTGLGVNNTSCVPVTAPGQLPCTITVAAADALGASYGDPGPAVITYRLPATMSIDSVTGQTGNQAARSGDTINVSGGNWDANGTLTAELCDLALTSCEATLSGSATTNASGDLTGALTVDSGATSGSRAVKLTDGVQTASAPIQILGARTITLSPNAGGIGTNVTVTGSGFNAFTTVALSQLVPDAVDPVANPPVPTGAPAITASSATGAVTAVIAISDLATIGIGGSELDGANAPVPGTEVFAPFSASGNTCTVPDGGECSVLETVTLVVNPGTLSLEQADNQVTMSPITLDGTTQTSTGDVQALTINDARGSLVGWSVTAIMTDLNGPGGSNSTIAAGNMTTVSPTCVAVDGSDVGITAGADAQAFDPVTRVTLCTAAVGEGGGTYAANSGLSLIVPSNIRSGTYTATLTILLA